MLSYGAHIFLMSRLIAIDNHPAFLPASDLGGEHLVVWGIEWFTVGGRWGEEVGTMGDTLHLSRPEGKVCVGGEGRLG